jgi:endonuclease/exonuclease/phosphatase family metal-dependent hydrolase
MRNGQCTFISPDKLRKIEHRNIAINQDGVSATRDILYASFAVLELDTVHFFINHWPSRFGGKEFTKHKRSAAAQVLKSKIDSLQKQKPAAKVLITGDFNDEPSDESIREILQALPYQNNAKATELYNLSFPDYRKGAGTIVYKEIDHTWFLFDQIIVSGTLVAANGLMIVEKKNHIFKAEWLLKDDRPYRTYQGPIYLGGFSDHLPIFIDLHYKD